ncbi:hypothetical protein Htur_1201 [Haloterrigena turkmenica DSM 5511]|uniref:Uncharacterized protein n=1 Tax=Haloterrigena turkmenica (strain ATCC 51198 / DSM 5511 / JCM 9101 / NCIMB 13204 / VKM B-1734 / 4k) TaxID=543526 RepID=D2RP59_HALTV|nr:hypothetical protein [Haloterrigena turkmenica]ADB60093.1 hypothetical protein Htur_1201 [Haloterrigena turkmenica DSM 5511]
MGSMLERLTLDRRDIVSGVLVAVTLEVVLIYQTGVPDPSQWGSRLASMVLTAVAFVIVLLLSKRVTGGDRATLRSE